MKINKPPARSTGIYHVSKGEIRSDRKPGMLVWQREGARIFITCRGCDAINDITNHQTEYHSRKLDYSCFVCTNCHTHYYFELLGWEPPGVVKCRLCRNSPHNYRSFVMGKGEIRFLRKKGWTIDPKDAQNSVCPCCRLRK